ncbi:MAG: NYN domain-containing protein [Chitinispirillia bacterium]|nr:NYN domain-containing protein [Chitinispirillia bacterium]MCL2269414.1 NYN domain-containing protein [Chitinispirillia bacterium]
MARVSFFIDGFNLYHALNDNNENLQCFNWLNLRKLAELYIRKQDSLVDVFYFTALATWDPDKVRRQKLFIRAQESLGIKTIYGEFRNVTRRCLVCGKTYGTFEEKETDVNIAAKLLEQAHLNTYDNAVILSGDSDQIPAIKTIKKTFPAKKIGVLIPPDGRARLLSQNADFYSKIGPNQLSSSKLQDKITIADGTQIHCPKIWMQKSFGA